MVPALFHAEMPVLCGIAAVWIEEYSAILKELFEAFSSLFLTVTAIITKLIPAINPIPHMFVTTSNTTGDMAAALIVAKSGKLPDLKKLR